MKLLIQAGNKGSTVLDHLVRPIAEVETVTKLLIVSRERGTDIPKAHYHSPPAFARKMPPLAVLFELLISLRLSMSEEPQCVIAFKVFPHSVIAFLVSRLTHRPLIISLIAGPVELYSIGSPTRTDVNEPLTLKGRLIVALLSRSEAIVTTGSFTKNFLVKHGLQHDRVFPVIHTPSADQYHPILTEKIYDVILVGRLVRVKNVETLLKAISSIRSTKENIKACVVGDGPDRRRLHELSIALGIRENVDFVGFQEDVVSYLNKSRVFVLTSEREGFPNVLLEAMMCGLPSVVSNCGDVTDLAVDGYNSVVIQDYDDYGRFSDAIIKILSDHDLYQHLSENALKSTEDFSINRATYEWQKILSTVNHESKPLANNLQKEARLSKE